VSLAVFRDGRALVARRARAPLLGLYSLPGGVVEIGETLHEAALRELDEEVGVKAEIVAFNDHVESIVRDDSGGVQAHYVIASFVARWIGGEPRTSEEADSVMWVDPTALGDLPTTPGLRNILIRADSLIGAFP
jgi:8-oxo-dGTP diphosphatase